MDVQRPALTDDTKVIVYNEYYGSVSYKTEHVSRVIQHGGSREVELKELKQLILVEGQRKLFDKNYLIIKDGAVRDLLGLEPLEGANLTLSQMHELLNSRNLQKVEEFLQYTSNENLAKFVRAAVELPLKDLETANLMKAYTNINVIQAISDRDSEETQKTGIRQRVDGKAPEHAATPLRGRVIPKD